MLYALLDTNTLKSKNISIEDFIAHILANHSVPMLQYRNKEGSLEEQALDLVKIRSIYNGTIIVNDFFELINYADGVHLGQDDLKSIADDPKEAIKEVRDIIGRKTIGISTHNKEEILVANGLDIDYIGLGAYRSSETKTDAKVSGEDLIEISKLSINPVGMIGGVKVDDVFKSPIVYNVVGTDLYKGL